MPTEPSSFAPRDRPDRAADAARSGWLALGLVILVAVIYAQARAFGFVNIDDQQYVYENPFVLRGLTWAGVTRAFGTFQASNWHPLTWLSHMVDVQLFGVEPGWHHAVNVVLHAANTVLLFLFLRRVTAATFRSAAVAALFAVHPLHVESVAWISERKDVLSAALFLLALHAYVSWVQRPSRRRQGLVAGLFALGVLAKPMVVTLPFVLLLLDVWPLERLRDAPSRSERRSRILALLREKVPLFALCAGACAVTFFAQRAGDATVALSDVPLSARLTNALLAYAGYLGHAAWPAGLAAFYPHPWLAGASVPAWQVAGAATLLIAASAIAAHERARRPFLLWGWCWYLGTLIPVIGVVQVGTQASADRYTYLPLVGIFVAVVWAAAEVLDRVRASSAIRWAAAVLPLVALALASRTQAAAWRDSVALHRHALAVTERNWNAWSGLGDALSDAGRTGEAIDAYREALGIYPRLATAWNGLGAAFGRVGAHAEAIAPLENAVRIAPRYADAWYNLGTAYGNLGEHAKAARCFRAAVEANADHARAWSNLAIASLALGDRATALESLRRLRQLDSGLAGTLASLLATAPMR